MNDLIRIARMTRDRRGREVLAAARQRAAGELRQDELDGVVALYDAACRKVERLEAAEAERQAVPRWRLWTRRAVGGLS